MDSCCCCRQKVKRADPTCTVLASIAIFFGLAIVAVSFWLIYIDTAGINLYYSTHFKTTCTPTDYEWDLTTRRVGSQIRYFVTVPVRYVDKNDETHRANLQSYEDTRQGYSTKEAAEEWGSDRASRNVICYYNSLDHSLVTDFRGSPWPLITYLLIFIIPLFIIGLSFIVCGFQRIFYEDIKETDQELENLGKSFILSDPSDYGTWTESKTLNLMATGNPFQQKSYS